MKKLLFLWLIAVFALGSCKKDFAPTSSTPNNPPATTAKNFSELKASNTFSWKVTRPVTLEVAALKTYSTVKGTIRVMSADGQDLIIALPHQMDKSLSVKLDLATRITEVKVQFGSIVKTVPISNSKISFDFLPTLPKVN